MTASTFFSEPNLKPGHGNDRVESWPRLHISFGPEDEPGSEGPWWTPNLKSVDGNDRVESW